MAGDDPPGRIAATASLTAWRFCVAKASSPSAPSSVGFGWSGSRVWTVATTERPGRSVTSFSTSSGKVTRTATRCTTLVKLPVALSGGSSENCAPEAGEIDDTTP